MIAISGHYLDATGYGETARRYTYALQQAGQDVTIGVPCTDNLGQLDPKQCWRWAHLDEFIKGKGQADVHFMVVMAPKMPIIAEMVDAPRVVGFTAWETDKIPDAYVSTAAELDGMVVPCQWNKDVYAAKDVTSEAVLIPAILPERPEIMPNAAQSMRKSLGISESTYVFYSIGTWQPRKNFEGVVTAYLHGFTGFDDVALLLKIAGSDADVAKAQAMVDAMRRAARVPNSPRIVISGGRNMTDEALWALHAAGDCYVSMTRGEACGIPMLDAACMGRVVIAPDRGGHTDYMGYYSRYSAMPTVMTPVMQDYLYFTAKQCWVDTSVLATSVAMQARASGGRVPLDIAIPHKDLSPQVIGTRLAEVLYGH